MLLSAADAPPASVAQRLGVFRHSSLYSHPQVSQGACVGTPGEPVVIQALIAESAVERLNVCVLVRFAGLDQSQRDAVEVGPCQHRSTRKFRAVAGSYNCGLAVSVNQAAFFQLA